MAKIKINVPYFVWRDGRPRWNPGPKLRDAGWRGRDLKDALGQYLPLEAALQAARNLNAEVAAGGKGKTPASRAGETVGDLLRAYFASAAFERLQPNTQTDYRIKANVVLYERRSKSEAQRRKPNTKVEPMLTLFATAPARTIGKPETLGFYEGLLREGRSIGVARGAIMVLSAAYQWGSTSPDWRLKENPCQKLRLPSPEARLRVASVEEIRALVAAADAMGRPSIGDAIYLGLFTGQREADILHLVEPFGTNRPMSERAAAGEPIHFLQRKTKARVDVYVAPQLVVRLAAADKRKRALDVVPSAIVVSEITRDAYPSADNFRKLYAKVRALAIKGDEKEGLKPCPSLASFNFQDLRDTCVTWLARAGADLKEIASITGHSLRGIHTIMKHYLALDGAMARRGIEKLVAMLEAEGMAL